MNAFLSIVVLLAATASAYEWHNGACGVSSFEGDEEHMGYIVGGQEVKPHEFPWQILMMKSGRFACGGIIINKNWVLTAAHCVSSSTYGLELLAGRHQLCTSSCPDESSTEQRRTVKRVIRHEDYNSRTIDNDVALLEVSSPFLINSMVMPACRPTPNLNYVGARAFVSGWGTTSSGGRVASKLRYVGLPVISNAACNLVWQLSGKISDAMMCAGDIPERKYDACQGDSGGPLVTMRPEDGRFEIIGVVSWGYGCASGAPGVYARVPYLINWIDAQLEANS